MVVPAGRPRRQRSEDAGPANCGGSGGLGSLAEATLRQLFCVQDRLTEAQAVAVAARTGCTPAAALARFAALRAAASGCLQQAREHAAAAAAEAWQASNGRANGDRQRPDDLQALQRSLAAAASARAAATVRLQALLGSGGGLRDMSITGQFVELVATTRSSVARTAAAAAVAASRRSIARKLVAHRGFLAALEGWLEAARKAEQHSLLHAVLRALAALPLEPTVLRSAACTGLVLAVHRLRSHAHAPVAIAAGSLAAEWQQLVQSGAPAGGGPPSSQELLPPQPSQLQRAAGSPTPTRAAVPPRPPAAAQTPSKRPRI